MPSPYSRPRLKTIVALAAAGASGLVAVPPASAATYDVVVGCQRGSAFTQADPTGWHQGTSSRLSSQIGCQTPWAPADGTTANDGLSTYPNGQVWTGADGGDRTSGWTFLAPGAPYLRAGAAAVDASFADTPQITAVTNSFVFNRNGNDRYTVGVVANVLENPEVIYGCPVATGGLGADGLGLGAPNCDPTGTAFPVTAGDGRTLTTPAGTHALSFLVQCPDADCPTNSPSQGYAGISSAGIRLTIDDSTQPEVKINGGGLAAGEGPALTGAQSITFDAKDISGVDRAELLVDGQVIGGIDYPCANAAGQALTRRVPCPSRDDRVRTAQTVSLDTASLRDAKHTATLRIYDAVGNVTDTSFPFESENNGDDPERETPGVQLAGSATEIAPAARYKITPGTRSGISLNSWRSAPLAPTSRSISAIVRDDGGKGIPGAKVLAFRAVAGQQTQFAEARADSNGQVKITAPYGPEKAFTLLYIGSSTRRGALAKASMRFRASTSIKASKSRLRNGQSLTLSGAIASRPVIQGKRVLAQALVRGSWRTFRTTRASLAGRWKVAYRFTATRRPTTFRFRIVVPKEGQYGFETGNSQTVTVRVRP